MPRIPGAIVLIGILLLCSADAASPSWRGRADSLYLRADDAFEAGEYREAAEAYGLTIEELESSGGIAEDGYFGRLAAKSRFLRARSHEHLERWEEAIADYELCLTEMSEIWDLVHVRLAACHAGLGDFDSAVAELRFVIDDDESTAFGQLALKDLAGYHEEEGDVDMALQWARVYLARADSYDERALGHLRLGQVYEKRGDREAAVESYATAVNEFPRSVHSNEALKRGRSISRAFTDRYHQGLVLYNRNLHRESAEFFLYYLRHDREKEFEAEASYFLGRSYQRRGRFGTAARQYEDAVSFGVDSEYFDLAWSKLAYCRRADGRLSESLATYDTYVSLHGDREAAPEMLWEKARLLEEKQRWSEAEVGFRDAGERYPDSARAADALFRAALCLYKMDDYARAESSFADLFIDADGEEAARALFWAGKCREALRAPDEAVARYIEAAAVGRDSYYGVRSRDRLADLGHAAAHDPGSPRAVPAGRPIAGRAGVWSGELLDFAAWLAEWYDEVYFPAGRMAMRQELYASRPLVRAEIFLALHMRDRALDELSALLEDVGRDPRALDILNDYCRTRGLNKRAILLAERILSLSPEETLSEVPVYLRRRICPVHFSDTVESHCRETGVDLDIFYSLVRQESLFEPTAVSWVGARGLSQIMPRTGRWLARKLGHRGFHTSDLFDPEINVGFGTRYLAMQLEEFDGDVLRALAAYNGGTESAARWWEYGGGRDSDVFVEDIGYDQTAGYVRRIYRYSETYRDAYGLSGSRSSQR